MKKMITMALVVFSMTAFAQQQEVKVQQSVKKEFSGKHQFKKGKRFHKGDMVLKELDLTENQKIQVKELKDKQRVEHIQLRKQHNEEFNKVLTTEQIQKLDKLKVERIQKRKALKDQVKQ